MKRHYSALELAGKLGMPSTKRGVNKLAAREQWEFIERQGRGGGREYHLDSLPSETQEDILSSAIQAGRIAPPIKPASSNSVRGVLDRFKEDELKALDAKIRELEYHNSLLAALPEEAQQKARVRLAILQSFWRYIAERDVSAKKGFITFIPTWKAGLIDVEAWVYEKAPRIKGQLSLSESTLKSWLRAYDKKGTYGLVADYGQRKGSHKITQHPKLLDAVVGLLIQKPHITPLKIKEFLAAIDHEQRDNPEHIKHDVSSESGIRRFLTYWKTENQQIYMYLTQPDKWKNKYMVAHGSHFDGIDRLNQLWEMDSTPADWMLQDGRHSVVQVLDMYSRRLMFLVTPTSTADALITIFRKAVMAWGMPEIVRTDNGKDYVSRRFTEALEDLQVVQQLCVPFASEEKGTVERTFKTMLHSILDLLPGFIGHNVAERKQIEARKSFAKRVMTPGEAVEVEMTAAELQDKLDQWVRHIYMHNSHGGLNGLTPFQMVANWRDGIRTVDERALDLLLMEIAGTRTVTKNGVRYENYEYIHPALGEFVGKTVRLKRDEDMGRLYVYGNDDNPCFICVALCPDLTDIARNEFAVAAKQGQKKLMQTQAAELNKLKRDQKRDVFETVVSHRISVSDSVTAMPHRKSEHTTAALEAAKQAADHVRRKGMPAPSLSDEQQAQLRRFKEQNSQQQRKSVVNNTSDLASRKRANYQRWKDIDAALAVGESVNEEDQTFWDMYQRGSEFKSQHRWEKEIENAANKG